MMLKNEKYGIDVEKIRCQDLTARYQAINRH